MFCKKGVFKYFANSQENTCAEAFFSKVIGLALKPRLQHKSFPVNFAKLLRTFILYNICERLLLNSSMF